MLPAQGGLALLGSRARTAVFAALLSIAAPASAQPPLSPQDERARPHFESGAAYYDAGEYESALREFQSAYELSHRPALNFNIYLCHQALGNFEEAAASLERFLAEVEDIPNRETLQQRLANLRERIRRRAAGQPDVPEPDPGTPTTAPPARSGGGGLNVPAIIGFSVAAVGVVGAAIFGPLTLAEDASLASSPCGQAMTCSPADISTLQTYALLTDISFAVALAGAVAGTILFFVIDTSGGSGETALRVSPLAAPGLAGLSIGGAL